MSGHSKWNNIKRKKGAADAARAKTFTKLGREIQVAVRSGGGDPSVNTTLRDVIAKAKAQNMPNDNIQRSIDKAMGSGNTDNFEEMIYEGYGPGGVAIMVKTLSDNKNRTAGDVRHIFDKFGGNLGTTGCVAFQFEEKGKLILNLEDYEDEEQLMMDALEAGAEDFEIEEQVYVITVEPENYSAVREALEEKSYQFEDISLGLVPMNWVQISEEQQVQMDKLIQNLEDHDDVQDVSHNWE